MIRSADDYSTVLTDPATYVYDPVPSRETIYLDELYFAAIPDAPRTAPADPGYASGDVIAAFIGDTYTTDAFAGQGSSFTIDGTTVAQKWENLQAQIQLTPTSPFTLASSASADAPVMHLDIWRDDPGVPADLQILLVGPHVPVFEQITVSSADVPTNQWVSLAGACPRRVRSTAAGDGPRGARDRRFTNFIPQLRCRATSTSVTSTSPTGTRSPRRASWHRTRLISGSAPRTRPSLSIPFGAIVVASRRPATVKTSPNGDRALEVVKDTGAAEGPVLRLPTRLGWAL